MLLNDQTSKPILNSHRNSIRQPDSKSILTYPAYRPFLQTARSLITHAPKHSSTTTTAMPNSKALLKRANSSSPSESGREKKMPAIQGLNANTSSVEQVRASAEQNSLSESHKATLQNNNISARAFSTNDAASTALGHTMSPNDPLIRRVTTTANFPEVLYSMIMYCEREGYNDVISFFSHGRVSSERD